MRSRGIGCTIASIGSTLTLLILPPVSAQDAAGDHRPQPAAWHGPRLRVGVLDLSGSALQMQSATAPSGMATTSVAIPAPADFSHGLTQMLTTSLIEQDRFVVLERAALDKVSAEQDLAAGGRVNPETAATVGKLTGAQVLITGDITEFTYQQSSVGSKLSIIKNLNKQIGGKIDRVTAQVAIDLRIIDAVTGQVIGSTRGRGKASATGLAADLTTPEKELAAGGTVQTPLGRASRQAIEQAVEELVAAMEQVPWSGRVVDVRGGQVYINAGSKLGIEKGMELDVFAQAEALTDPETGVALGTPDERSGRVAITQVAEKYAIGRVLEGKGFKRNDLVRYHGAAQMP
jgi:curli biogenesis system outer membrane secretion channel CsgG